MEKLKMQTPDLIERNIIKVAELFPNCVTEDKDEKGNIRKSIDFELLKQELSKNIVEGVQERYHLNWPGKREALFTANSPIAKTLRPCREESVQFDNTQNLFVEGDNLDALKLLQETYLGKIKMIYIDPPYNTGNDFIYEDDYSENTEGFLKRSNQKNEEGNRMVANTESNGRFHSDWLSMMYSRLKLARNLLSDDGAIFISIDENEQANLKRLCDEVFGEENFRNCLITRRRVKSLNAQFADDGLYSMNVGFEYVLVYAKSPLFLMNALRMKKENVPIKGSWNVFWSGADRPTMRYELLGFTPSTGQWRWSKVKAEEAIRNYERYLAEYSSKISLEDYWSLNGKELKFIRRIPDGEGKNGGVQYWIGPSDTSLRSTDWTDIEVSQIQKEFDLPFTNPKSLELVKTIFSLSNESNFIALDFFAGSCTTAQAIMQLNAEDGGNRKFIMVQIPELCDENSEGFRAEYKTIAEIGKERIRQAGKKIKESNATTAPNLDIGFRVLKVDTSSMQDVHYNPDAYAQESLFENTDNIKLDRTDEDLLFQVLLDWGVDLSLPVTKEQIAGHEVYFVNGNALASCFTKNGSITEDFCKQLAKRTPLRVVFRDAGFKDDSVKINVEQIFRLLSPHTEVKTV